jgi:hypothetical protein
MKTEDTNWIANPSKPKWIRFQKTGRLQRWPAVKALDAFGTDAAPAIRIFVLKRVEM